MHKLTTKIVNELVILLFLLKDLYQKIQDQQQQGFFYKFIETAVFIDIER